MEYFNLKRNAETFSISHFAAEVYRILANRHKDIWAASLDTAMCRIGTITVLGLPLSRTLPSVMAISVYLKLLR
jgi:hypothetical protein